jgi:hypothetical protein
MHGIAATKPPSPYPPAVKRSSAFVTLAARVISKLRSMQGSKVLLS